jgi:aspartokinase
MSRAGAGVIHHKTVLPLQAAGLELHVKCFAEPGVPGTVIRKAGQKKYPAPLIAFAEYPEGVREVSILNAEPNEARAIIEKKFPSWSIETSRQEGAMAVLRCRISIRLR